MPKTLLIILALIIAFSVNFASAATFYSGKIFLQVAKNGEAWYISPVNNQRYFLGRPDDAFNIMRGLGLGISNKNLAQIPIGILEYSGLDSDDDGLPDGLESAIGLNPLNPDSNNDDYADKTEIENWSGTLDGEQLSVNKNLIASLKGRILLQTEKHGEAWYLNPSDSKRYYLGRPADAFAVMRSLGIGITNANLAKISENYTKVKYAASEYYELKYPSIWTVKVVEAKTLPYASVPIVNKVIFTSDSATLEILVFEPQSDLGLKDFNISSKKLTAKDKEESLMIGVKPARKQIFRYTSKTTADGVTFDKGAEYYVDIMVTTKRFIRLHLTVPASHDLINYENILATLLKDMKIVY